MNAVLAALPPKMYELSSVAPPTPIVRDGLVASKEHVARAVKRIEEAHFIGKGDKAIVKKLYTNYIDLLANTLQRTIGTFAHTNSEVASVELPAMPTDTTALRTWHLDVLRIQQFPDHLRPPA